VVWTYLFLMSMVLPIFVQSHRHLKITRLRYLCPMLISTFSVPVRLEVVNQVYTSVELSVNAQ